MAAADAGAKFREALAEELIIEEIALRAGYHVHHIEMGADTVGHLQLTDSIADPLLAFRGIGCQSVAPDTDLGNLQTGLIGGIWVCSANLQIFTDTRTRAKRKGFRYDTPAVRRRYPLAFPDSRPR